MKKIDTLVDDIYNVVDGQGGWDKTVSDGYSKLMEETLDNRFNASYTGSGSLRMSNVGSPCGRKLWLNVNEDKSQAEGLQPNTRLKFLYGDIIEELLLSLAEAAGHKVEGRQDEMEIHGIKGHRDAVIDGVLIDVKSASPYAFKKFRANKLREDDAFGYIGQLSSYLLAAQDDPLVTEKNKAGFLVMDKVHGHLTLDMYDLTDDMVRIEELIEQRKEMVAHTSMPAIPKQFEPRPFQKSGNMELSLNCGYCEWKHKCYPDVRSFAYPNKVVHLSKVVREPKVMEII